jgi:hypothetical protein
MLNSTKWAITIALAASGAKLFEHTFAAAHAASPDWPVWPYWAHLAIVSPVLLLTHWLHGRMWESIHPSRSEDDVFSIKL